MILVNQLPFTKTKRRTWVGPPAKDWVPPELCDSEMRDLFKLGNHDTIYATVSRERPTAKRLQAAYLEFKYDESGFLDIRHPWNGERWEFMPALDGLDTFILPKIKINRRYYVWFEVDG